MKKKPVHTTDDQEKLFDKIALEIAKRLWGPGYHYVLVVCDPEDGSVFTRSSIPAAEICAVLMHVAKGIAEGTSQVVPGTLETKPK